MARKSCGLVREHLVCRTNSGSILTTSGDCSSAAPLLPRNSPILGRNGQSPKKGFLVSNSRVCLRNGNIHSPHNRGYTSLTPHLPPPHSARFSRHEERETPDRSANFSRFSSNTSFPGIFSKPCRITAEAARMQPWSLSNRLHSDHVRLQFGHSRESAR